MDLGERFEQEVRYAVRLVSEHPRIGAPLTKRLRKLRLRTFPYNLIYVTEDDEIVIVAVAHHKRRPGYWRIRLGYIR